MKKKKLTKGRSNTLKQATKSAPFTALLRIESLRFTPLSTFRGWPLLVFVGELWCIPGYERCCVHCEDTISIL